jgi:hypothetical protein
VPIDTSFVDEGFIENEDFFFVVFLFLLSGSVFGRKEVEKEFYYGIKTNPLYPS